MRVCVLIKRKHKSSARVQQKLPTRVRLLKHDLQNIVTQLSYISPGRITELIRFYSYLARTLTQFWCKLVCALIHFRCYLVRTLIRFCRYLVRSWFVH